MTTESQDAAARRRGRCGPHTVLDYVKHPHTMNGRRCENPWAVIRYRRTGSLSFYCGECGVGHNGGGGYQELLALTDAVDNTNPNATGYPGRSGPAAVKAYFDDAQAVFHVPPDRLGDVY